MAGSRNNNDLSFFAKNLQIIVQFCGSIVASAHEGESRGRKRVDLGGGLPVSADNY